MGALSARTTNLIELAPRVPFPERSECDRLMSLPIVAITATGRSGTLVLHAFLDGHPAIVHVPNVVKFHDFVHAHRIVELTGGDLADAFLAFGPHAALFDTRSAVLGQARLGATRTDAVLVDRDAFRQAVVSLIPSGTDDPRTALSAVFLAFSWAAGQDLRRAEVILQHMHHGDWLAPSLAIDPYNLPDVTSSPEVIFDRLLVTMRRDARRAFVGCSSFASRFAPEDAPAYTETLMHLLGQDEARLELMRRVGAPRCEVALEDMADDPVGTIGRVARWLGIDATEPALANMTLYGLQWWGDNFSRPAAAPHGGSVISIQRRLPIADRLYLRCLVGRTSGHTGVPRIPLRIARMAMAAPVVPRGRRDFARKLATVQDAVAAPRPDGMWLGPVDG